MHDLYERTSLFSRSCGNNLGLGQLLLLNGRGQSSHSGGQRHAVVMMMVMPVCEEKDLTLGLNVKG